MSWKDRRAKRQETGVPRGRKLLHPNAATPTQLEALENGARSWESAARLAEQKNDARADQLRAKANAARIAVEKARRDSR